LVLADALTYIQQTFDPKLIVDLATLTGAIMISLGLNYCGAFVNDNPLWEQLEKSSAATGEKIWRMPLDEMFRREMDSPFADIKNIGAGRYGGSCTAAAFLGEFIDAGRPWAHLDIAGVAMSKATPTCPVPFASGYGIKLLNKFVEDFHG
jgi:leucyl aminopeptidase